MIDSNCFLEVIFAYSATFKVCFNFLVAVHVYQKDIYVAYFVCRIMNWTEEHDVVFCREIIFVNPFSAKKKSVQRSALWQRVADTLNSIKDPVFFVDKRSVRDHIGVLVQRFKRKEAKELKESPTKTELDEAIEQIIAMEESADEQRKGDKMEGDRLKAEEMRRTATETDIRENTEEKVRGGAEQSEEKQKKW